MYSSQHRPDCVRALFRTLSITPLGQAAMPRIDASPPPASDSAPVTSAARYIGDEAAVIRVPNAVVLALGISDGTRLLWTSSSPNGVRVSVSPDNVEWRAASDSDPASESFFPAATTRVVRYIDDGVAVVQVPPAFAAVLALVDTARLRWAVAADQIAEVTIDPADVERVRAIRVEEDDRMIEGLTRGLGAIPDYPLGDDD